MPKWEVHFDVAEKDGIDRETIEEWTQMIDKTHSFEKNPRKAEAYEIEFICKFIEEIIPNFPEKSNRLPSLRAACHHATLDLLSRLGLNQLVKIAKKNGLTEVYEEIVEKGTYDHILNSEGRETKKEYEIRSAKEVIEKWHKIHRANKNGDLQKWGRGLQIR